MTHPAVVVGALGCRGVPARCHPLAPSRCEPWRRRGPFRGDERLIFSVDYPFAGNRRARDWLDHLDLTAEAREKIAHRTVDQVLRLR